MDCYGRPRRHCTPQTEILLFFFKFATLNEVSNIHERTNTRSSAIPSGCGGTSEGVVLAVVVIVMAGLVVMVVGGRVTFRGTGGVPHWTVTADHADTAHHKPKIYLFKIHDP